MSASANVARRAVIANPFLGNGKPDLLHLPLDTASCLGRL